MKLFIVESPAKSKTITGYLGSEFKVLGSYGHIRDLPSKDGSVDPTNDFAMNYQISDKATKPVSEIVKYAKESDEIYLATDQDREGEAISWHILEVLKQKKVALTKKKIHRITYNQITKAAVLDAIAHPRDIDFNLVDAQQARLALDYLVGFNVSPVLWRKLPGSKSAGRVQSVALRIITERESEIERFKKEEYWTIESIFNFKGAQLSAILDVYNGTKLEKFSIPNKDFADSVISAISPLDYTISDVAVKETYRRPYAPFTTSTLQQDAASKLGFAAKRTMQVAQSLYEGVKVGSETKGLITYMRTDSPAISDSGNAEIRKYIKSAMGDKYVAGKTNVYAAKAKNAQEAHEAIRPTDISITPEKAAKYLKDDEAKLYELIWRRAVASQASDAVFESTKIEISDAASKHTFKSNGSVLTFDGFLAIYTYSDSSDTLLPKLKTGDAAKTSEIKPIQHFTQPPPRYTEASLVKKLEELGIGRPSTYASIISIIQERGYVKIDDKKRFIPEERGRVVSAFLESFFPQYVDYDFTAKLEEDLDIVSDGKLAKLKFLQGFWTDFKANVDQAMDTKYEDVAAALEKRLEYHFFKNTNADSTGDAVFDKQCPECKTGTLKLLVGKFGPFISCSNYPTCKHIVKRHSEDEAPGAEGEGGEGKPKFANTNVELGKDSKGNAVFLKKGPYGFYLELDTGAKKPQRSTIPKGVPPTEVTLAFALKLLELPRVLGKHPDTGHEITSGMGIYGPYVCHNKKYSKLKTFDEIFTVDLAQAIGMIKV